MTPLGGMFRRLTGRPDAPAGDRAPRATADTRNPTPTAARPAGARTEDTDTDTDADARSGRRRGRRGGRRERARREAAARRDGEGGDGAVAEAPRRGRTDEPRSADRRPADRRPADHRAEDHRAEGGRADGGRADGGRADGRPARAAAAEDEPSGGRGRRRRGGRGRGGRGEGETRAEGRSVPATESTAGRRGGREDARAGDGDRGRDGRGRRRSLPEGVRRREWRNRAPRESLDPALPEDIAFRPASEGGDRSILPARRRPPPGPRTTQRVIVPDARYIIPGGEARQNERGAAPDPFRDWLSGEIDSAETDPADTDPADTDPRATAVAHGAPGDDDADRAGAVRAGAAAAEQANDADDADDADHDAGDDADDRPRRRRGRRGGRGRRRGARAADEQDDRDDDDRAAAQGDAQGDAHADDDDDDAHADDDDADDDRDDDDDDEDEEHDRPVRRTRRAVARQRNDDADDDAHADDDDADDDRDDDDDEDEDEEHDRPVRRTRRAVARQRNDRVNDGGDDDADDDDDAADRADARAAGDGTDGTADGDGTGGEREADRAPRVAARRRPAARRATTASPVVVAGSPREAVPAAASRNGDGTAPAPGAEPAAAAAEPPPASPRPRSVPRHPAQSAVPAAFAALGISQPALEWLAEVGFDEPTPVQREAIPVLLGGRDVVGVAQTGTGKTLAFGIPMAEALDAQRAVVQAIVLVPTRELAQQVEAVLSDLGRYFDLRTIGLLGGRRLDDDFRALDSGPQVVVGTPGRVLDHLRRGTLSLRDVRYAVLDEADQMLDIGFMPDITRILSRTPRARQTALFSATMPTSVKNIVWRFMDDPDTVEIAAEYRTVETIEQVYFEVAQRDKVAGLRELVERELRGRSLIFCNTKRAVDNLAERLQGRGVTVGALHGDLDQRRRDRVVQRFRDGEVDVLIATNVAARGLDIPEVTHVVNYDVPQNAEEYVHRIGRTGRAGREGRAITFVSEHDVQAFEVLLAEFGEQMRADTLDLYAPSGS